LTADDRLLATELRSRGHRVEAVVWSDPSVDWLEYDAVVLRSCWDYHLRLKPFLEWLDDIDRFKAPIWNPTKWVRWNIDKRYLRELDRQGFPVVDTRYEPRGSESSLVEVMDALGVEDVVVKPVVSASAHRTWAGSRTALVRDEERFAKEIRRHDVMVQPLVEEIRTEGEWSLQFIEGRYSHAVLKVPSPGEFRVQEHHGGTIRKATPTAPVLEVAQAVVEVAARSALYARVDLVDTNDGPRVMELELIEPSMFFSYEPTSAPRFARALEACVAGVEGSPAHD
jgi:glutathione synthase/RimK-type ligase-like ATP-grasp enzyme